MREIALHILDIVQNSVAASASVISITIVEDRNTDRLSLTITDDGKGMDPKTVERVTDPFYTTRTTRKVGLGLPMLKMAAVASSGSFSISSKVGEGTTVEACYQLSHIDRPPLGDMVSSMLAILLGNEAMNILYSHTVDERIFAFESREMKEALDGLSFQTPDVYTWLKEYLTENEEMLYA